MEKSKCKCGHEYNDHIGEIVKVACLFAPFSCSCSQFSAAEEKKECPLGDSTCSPNCHLKKPKEPLPPKEKWEDEFDKLMDGVRCPIKECGDEECIKIGLLAFIRSLLAAEKKKEPSPLPPKEKWEDEFDKCVGTGKIEYFAPKEIKEFISFLLQKEKEEAYEKGKKEERIEGNNRAYLFANEARSTAIDDAAENVENHLTPHEYISDDPMLERIIQNQREKDKYKLLTSLHALKEKHNGTQ